MKTFVFRWVPPLVWMGLIFFFSAQPSLPRVAEPPLQLILSKTAHFLEYLVLALLLARAQASPAGRLSGRAYAVAFVVSALYAASDEFHQSFVPNRTALLTDVGIDSAGAGVGLIALWLRERTKGG